MWYLRSKDGSGGHQLLLIELTDPADQGNCLPLFSSCNKIQGLNRKSIQSVTSLTSVPWYMLNSGGDNG